MKIFYEKDANQDLIKNKKVAIFKPLLCADLEYSNMRSGVRWAETTVISNKTPNSFSTSAASCITLRSDLLPIIIPTFIDSVAIVYIN